MRNVVDMVTEAEAVNRSRAASFEVRRPELPTGAVATSDWLTTRTRLADVPDRVATSPEALSNELTATTMANDVAIRLMGHERACWRVPTPVAPTCQLRAYRASPNESPL